jgi:N-acetyl-anhydromuramoyl-L-alanine amidase
LQLDTAAGLVRGFAYRPSPHCDDRPAGATIDLLVLHCISLPAGCYGTDDVERLFLGTLDARGDPAGADLASLRVSAHFFLRRDGAAIQFVPVQRRAWHAGVSRWAGRDRCNDCSVGIELEGTQDDVFTEPQYTALAALSRTLRAAYPGITADRIVAHSEIAPGRKGDPGPFFEWARYRAAIATV